MHKHAHRNLLSISQLTPSGLSYLLTLARELRWRDADSHALSGKTVVLIFEKPSLRTRVTFEVAVRRLGGWPVLLGPEESCLGRRESIPDMARNLGLWVDGIVARVYRHTSLEELASFSAVPVVNALSDYEHPCQAIADLLTLQNVWGDFRGRRLVYVGDWNNVARSLWKASDLAGLDFRAVCPKPFAPPPEELVIWSSDLDAVKGADAIYTDVWASMGHENELQDRVPIFTPYQVNETLLARTGKPTLFMHCLPAHRGLEVTDAVIDSECSLVLQQAANRLPVEMAVLISLLENHHEAASEESRAGLFRRSGHVDHHSLAQGKLWV